MNNPGLIKNFLAGVVLAARRFVSFGADDNTVILAAGKGIGVTTEIGAGIGERADVVMSGVAEVEYGGTIVRGQSVTSDAEGKAVAQTASPIHQKVIAGGAAGALEVEGILPTDTLVSVIRADVSTDTGTDATGNKVAGISDLTSEFTITDADEISNAEGTNTTGDTLIVTFFREVKILGEAMVSGVAGDVGSVKLK